MARYQEVINNIKKTSKARHHIRGRNFPFFTRQPERPKYKDDFNEIVGMIARESIGKNKDIKDLEESYRDNLLNLVRDDDINDKLVFEIFNLDFNSVTKPNMFLYYPVKTSNSEEEKELKGKKLVAEYITKLFRLDENTKWKSYITENDSNEIYEDFIMENLPVLNDKVEKNIEFNFFYQEDYIKIFEKDLEIIMSNKQFFNNNIALFLSYYYFYYIIQETYNLSKIQRKKFKPYYVFDKEKVSYSREAVKNGYNVIQLLSRDILLDNDLLDYLNELLNDHVYYDLATIYNDENLNSRLSEELYFFNKEYAILHNIDIVESKNLKDNIKILRDMLSKINISSETSSRYRKFYDEISNLNFIRRRGRYGYVLNATEDLILMFTTIIISDQNRILLKDLFNEFEARGLYFDKTSKKEIIDYFESINILEKLSDSGDAQYVRSIL